MMSSEYFIFIYLQKMLNLCNWNVYDIDFGVLDIYNIDLDSVNQKELFPFLLWLNAVVRLVIFNFFVDLI